jgi:tetratricopeptide (TPR) repeat protein
MRLARQLATGIALIAVLVISSMLLAYAGWVRSIEKADFAAAEAQFDHSYLPQVLLRPQYRVLVFNRARAMAAAGRNDDIAPWLEAAVKRVPALADDAEYHYWTGNQQYRKALAQSDKQMRRAGLQQAAASYRLALNSAPDDWDAKYNFQLTMRLLNSMRDKKEDSTEKMKQGGMKILREDTEKAKEQQQKLSPEKRS